MPEQNWWGRPGQCWLSTSAAWPTPTATASPLWPSPTSGTRWEKQMSPDWFLPLWQQMSSSLGLVRTDNQYFKASFWLRLSQPVVSILAPSLEPWSGAILEAGLAPGGHYSWPVSWEWSAGYWWPWRPISQVSDGFWLVVLFNTLFSLVSPHPRQVPQRHRWLHRGGQYCPPHFTI